MIATFACSDLFSFFTHSSWTHGFLLSLRQCRTLCSRYCFHQEWLPVHSNALSPITGRGTRCPYLSLHGDGMLLLSPWVRSPKQCLTSWLELLAAPCHVQLQLPAPRGSCHLQGDIGSPCADSTFFLLELLQHQPNKEGLQTATESRGTPRSQHAGNIQLLSGTIQQMPSVHSCSL